MKNIKRGIFDSLIVDNFAGGGGASEGIERALGRPVDIAVNHDPVALAMHRANHPLTSHLCEDVFHVDPRAATGGRRVGLAWFSPDCTHHSKARGGKPRSKKIRGLAWVAIRWARQVRPDVIVVENVEEFQTWGPLGDDGQPVAERAGETFRGWVGMLRRIGYTVDWRMLRACDYGAPTIRKRLFIIARCDGKPIVWPEPTHARGGAGGLSPWRTAAECIDWSIPCPSIFDRKRPLAENTLKRIAAGIRRYVIEAAEPFIVPLTHQGGDRVEGLDEPMRTVTGAHRGERAIVVPFVAGVGGRAGQSPERSVELPYQTITSKADAVVVAPTLIQTGYGERDGQAPRAPGLGKPMGTVVSGGGKHALVSAFLAKHYTGVVGSDLNKPIGTVTGVDHHSLVTAFVAHHRGKSVGADLNDPANTVTAKHHLDLVQAFLVKYYGTAMGAELTDPMHTITGRDRLGLVMVRGVPHQIIDIGMRMLTPRELFRAQGFGDDYIIDPVLDGKPLSKTAQVKACGNSVCPPMAEALVRANLVDGESEVAA